MGDPEQHREVVHLKEYVERLISDQARLIEQQRIYTERAVEKAEVAVDKRLTGMNEFREALKDQSARMATQEQLDRVRDRVNEIEKRMAVIAATSSLVTSVIVGLVVHYFVK